MKMMIRKQLNNEEPTFVTHFDRKCRNVFFHDVRNEVKEFSFSRKKKTFMTSKSTIKDRIT